MSTSNISSPPVYPSSLPFTCLSCDDPCTSSIDADLLSTIDTTSSMVGSIKPYARHTIVGVPTPWPSDIKDISDSVIPHLKEKTKDLPGKSLMSAAEGLDGMYQFPSWQFVNKIDESGVQQLLESKASRIPYKSVILVCIHQARDARCGTIGPLLIQHFQNHITELNLEKQVQVLGISHVGGHKYAGNVIVYHEDSQISGIWYGRVLPGHTRQILVDHVNGGKIIRELWRGSMKEA